MDGWQRSRVSHAGVVDGDDDAVFLVLSVVAAVFYGLVLRVVGAHLRDGDAVEVRRDSEGLVGSEEEVVLPGALAGLVEAGRRGDVGRLDRGKRLRERVELMGVEEGVHGVGPGADVAEEGVAVVADGRGTPGRGPAWDRSIRGDLANPVLEDQMTALAAAAEECPVLLVPYAVSR